MDLGFDGEINVNAYLELVENWWESSNNIYIPMRFLVMERVDGIAPEIPVENAQTVLIMGDTSENRDKFDYVCKVADAIMDTYRIK